MTRQEFIDEIQDWQPLIDFCNDMGCAYCEDIYSEESRDTIVNEALVDMARDASSWSDLLDTLNNITTGYYYYRRNYHGEWDGMDDEDFVSYKDDVLEWADENCIWDTCEEENDGYDYDDDILVADEPISVGELMYICSNQLSLINEDKK